MPDDLRQLEQGEVPRPPPTTIKPQAEPDGQTSKPDAPREPSTSTPKVDPAPVITKPEPKAPEREPEEAVRRRSGAKIALKPKPPEITVPFPEWKPEAGQRWDGPCIWKGTEGRGPNVPANAPPDWIACIYQCGKYQVKFYDILGKSGAECAKPPLFERAQRESTRFHKEHGKGL